jgi:hypothetical protein
MIRNLRLISRRIAEAVEDMNYASLRLVTLHAPRIRQP